MPAVAEQQAENAPEATPQPKGGKKKIIMIIVAVSAAVIMGVGGYLGYTMFLGKAKAAGKDGHGDSKAAKSTLIPSIRSL